MRLKLLRAFWWLSNPVVLRLARWFAVWGVLETRGHRSGVLRRVPVAISRDGSTIWVVVARGLEAAYVRNILAEPAVRIRVRGTWYNGAATVEPASTAFPAAVGRYARAAATLFPGAHRLLRIQVADANMRTAMPSGIHNLRTPGDQAPAGDPEVAL